MTSTSTHLVEEPATVSVNNDINQDEASICTSILRHGIFPNEFQDPDDGSEINIRSDAKGLVKQIGDQAREIILLNINKHFLGKTPAELGWTWDHWPVSACLLKENRTRPVPKSKDFQVINQKTHKYPLTKSMALHGWQQVMAKVSLISREAAGLMYPEDGAAAKALYKSMRYPVHFWVSPSVLWDQKNMLATQGLVFGKIKMEGKRPLYPKS